MDFKSFYTYILFIICIFSSCVIHAQTSVVFGLVRDIDSNQGIELVTVHEQGKTDAISSDLYGQYRIEITPDKVVNLIFSRLGYQEISIRVDPTKTFEKRNINVKMVPKTSELEVVVRAGRIEDVGMVREEVNELKILPTASGNFESILPHLALGLSAGSGGELTSQYNVRGGNYDENLVYVNDFEIFRPQLIRSGNQEGLSFPNIDLIRNLEFSSGGFSAKYGDKLSSVLDIRYKRPEETRASVTASFLGATAHVEGSKRLGPNAYNKFRYLIGARYKTNALLLGSGDITGEYIPSFVDVQAYLTYEINKNWQVAFISNYNGSNYQFNPRSGTTTKGTFDFQIQLKTDFEGGEESIFNYGMSGVGITYVPERKRNPLFMKLLASSYRASEQEKFDIIGTYRLSQIESTLGANTGQEVALLGDGTQHLYARNFLFNTVHNVEYKGGIELQTDNRGKNHFIQWGAKFQQENFDDKLNEWERIDSAGYSLPYDGNTVNLSKVLKTSNIVQNNRLQLYVEDGFNYENDRHELKLSAGLRATYRSLNDELLYSPRAQLLYRPKEWKRNMSFKLAAGIYNQAPLYREMRQPSGIVNLDLKSQKSTHFVAGMTYDFTMKRISNRPFKIISEIYYKKLDDIVSYELDNVRIRYAGQNDATGYVMGWDFRINGEFVKNAESWINVSFLTARERLNGVTHIRFEEIDSVRAPVAVSSVPRPTDQLMTINMFFQDYLPKNENVKVNLNFSIGSGLPFGPREDNVEARNIFRLKPYHRIDVGFSFQLWKAEWRKRKPNHFLSFADNAWLSIEAFNLLQISNQASVNWIKTVTNYEFALPNNLTGRRINLRVRVDF